MATKLGKRLSMLPAGESQDEFVHQPASIFTNEDESIYALPPTEKQLQAQSSKSQCSFFIVIACLFFGTFLVALDTTIIGTATPAITTEFHSLNDIAWYGSGYLLTLTALQPAFGKLFMIWDTKGIYLVCVVVFEVGSILCAAAPSSKIFIIGRAVQGIGAAGILQGALVIITRTVPLQKRPFYISVVISAFGLCVKIGPLLGGTFTDHVSWRWCFWINVPIGGVVILLLAVFLRLDSNPENEDLASRPGMQKLKSLDLPGMTLIICSIISLLLALQWGGQTLPWNDSKIIGLLVGAGLMFILFLLVQWYMGSDATLPFDILLQRSILSGAVYLLAIAMPTYVYGYYIPIYFQSVTGTTALRSGINFLALALPQVGFTVLSGWLASKFGYYTPYIISGTAISLVGSGLLTLLSPNTALGTWVAYFLVIALGTGIAINHPYTAVQTVLEERCVPVGNAIMQFTFSLGGALSLCIAQPVFTTRLKSAIIKRLPGVPVDSVIGAGAYGVKDLFKGNEKALGEVKLAYTEALRDVFIFALVAGGVALVLSFGFEHVNLKVVAGKRGQSEKLGEGRDGAGEKGVV
ncbi:MFS general substrate transporter [Sporormia fimetaria CBS 119925]|uniref:MFS general substrate transporter n=1 Tax=Sporormia fimetaria CBS 119925 TaxID=1340428 RepID=A0A6A6VB93_9PLEO|nr:MFS general substrate transporter [Sporormia fimetaria CBS 119925]